MLQLPPVNLLPSAIGELFAQVTRTGVITKADRYGLMAAILDETITLEEKQAIDRMLRALCRGRLQMVNELSAII
ncbi:MAG: hypothetical protein AB4352_17230 [Hormoscilla sp.]